MSDRMTVTEHWVVEGQSQLDRTAIVVEGPMPLRGYQIRMVRESDYEALRRQLEGAVEALRDLLVDIEDYGEPRRHHDAIARARKSLLTFDRTGGQ